MTGTFWFSNQLVSGYQAKIISQPVFDYGILLRGAPNVCQSEDCEVYTF